MQSWELDCAVLCIFFARPHQFKQTFQQVKRAKPRVLLLWQDGPRDGRADDVENIEKCRKIADDIDWECEVHRNYHDKNMGCDPSTFYSHKWAFSIVDKCIVLEDDIVASQSFFKFCKELLDKYEYDTRIDRICGQTIFGGVPDKRYSYFFGRNGSSWGWASWKRVADTWQENYEFLDDDYYLDLAKKRFGNEHFSESIANAKKRKAEEKAYWETIIGYRTLLSSGLVIYPKVNLIENVGGTANATHAPAEIMELPHDVREMFCTVREELEFPLKHPPYVIEDYHYFEKMMKFLYPSRIVRLRRKIEHLYRKIAIKSGIIKTK